jgi:hypothetical protein
MTTKTRHLTSRFVRALWPGPPRAADTEWVATMLPPELLAVWSKMPSHDRRHSIGVARSVEAALAGTPAEGDQRWITAALMHDVGKLDAGLGVYGRVVATVSGAVAGGAMADVWSTKRGFTRRVGLYLRHPELGANRIRILGGPHEAAAWAAAHHTPDAWHDLPIPPDVVAALAAADDD